jgi:uncharacterized coiled-coil protein SlyX
MNTSTVQELETRIRDLEDLIVSQQTIIAALQMSEEVCPTKLEIAACQKIYAECIQRISKRFQER